MKIIKTRAYARAGLIGNPSDGYYGKTISLIVKNFAAEAVIYEWPELEIIPTRQDQCRFDSLDDLLRDGKLNGYYGSMRLVRAAIKRFADYCRPGHRPPGAELLDPLRLEHPAAGGAGRVERDHHRDDPRPLRVLRSGHPAGGPARD